MHPYAQSSIAAAQRELANCIESLKSATTANGQQAWGHVAMALTHAVVAAAQLDDAVTVDGMMKEDA